MPKTHKIKQGEDIGSIAAVHGFLPETIWDEVANQELKEKRVDPNLSVSGVAQRNLLISRDLLFKEC